MRETSPAGRTEAALRRKTDSRGISGKPRCLDFFAGAGLATEALKEHFRVVWANDIDPRKAVAYTKNHPGARFALDSIENIDGAAVPPAEMAWASFPCQDLSLAGRMRGIAARRSGLVWEWLCVIGEMPRKPPILVAENVAGLVSAGGGEHYRSLHKVLVEKGYRVGALRMPAPVEPGMVAISARVKVVFRY
jgi:DNA (cytosine-5)-methyltransferase 1